MSQIAIVNIHLQLFAFKKQIYQCKKNCKSQMSLVFTFFQLEVIFSWTTIMIFVLLGAIHSATCHVTVFQLSQKFRNCLNRLATLIQKRELVWAQCPAYRRLHGPFTHSHLRMSWFVQLGYTAK